MLNIARSFSLPWSIVLLKKFLMSFRSVTLIKWVVLWFNVQVPIKVSLSLGPYVLPWLVYYLLCPESWNSSKFRMFWPVVLKQVQNISVDANVMPPSIDFARLGLGPWTPLVLTKYYIIITNTKPCPESFPAMINLPRFCWVPAVSLW